MTAPLVAIVGRPNVGKSTLFNRIAGERLAIVQDRPGITRDRLYTRSEWRLHAFNVVDTGGLELAASDPLVNHIRAQVEFAIDEADVICFVVDGTAGHTVSDAEIADLLRRSGKPVVVAVNKADNPGRQDLLHDFYRLGFDTLIGVSAEHGLGIGDLLDALLERMALSSPTDDEGEDETVRIAVIGRPNVGKSSLVNTLLGEERVLVSALAGTTRDAIDTPLTYADQSFILIDTAGVRKRGKIYERTEKYSVLRALRAIERCDVAVVLIDAVEGLVEQDKHVAGYALDAGKALLVAVNKWDAIEKDTKTAQEFERKMRLELPFLSWAPVIFISALTGRKVTRVLEAAAEAAESHALRIATSTVNTVVQEAVTMVPPPTDKGRRLKIMYCTQIGVKPPTFAVFVNDPELMHFSYQRYLENHLRDSFGFQGTPIRLSIRARR